MADLAVDFLLQNLQRLQIYHPDLIRDAENHLEMLENNLRLFKAFLKDSTKKLRKYESVRELARQIRDVVFEAEDTIDAFVSQAAESKTKNYFLRAFQAPAEKILAIAKDVESVGLKVRDIYGDRSTIDFAGVHINDDELEEGPLVRKHKNVVGVEDEAEKIIGYLREKTDELDIISIIGMPGLGKTTLAAKVFRDPAIEYEFRTRIWVSVSADFEPKNVFLDILREFTNLTEDMYRKSNEELARLIAFYLGSRGHFLIVMDDVWTPDDWDKIQIALPKSNNMGKVLITSRNYEVARASNRNRVPHKLRFLKPDESWLLLLFEVFGKPECPPELEGLTKVISGQCDGLPLAIVVVGGILVRKILASDGITAMKDKWRKVSRSLSMYLNEDPVGRMEKVISLNYDGMPYHLRMCLLYLRMFPEDFEIPVWKLIRMWMAEGFVQQKAGLGLEEVAESYLEDLISRNMVIADKRNVNGRVKTCRSHDMILDFCKYEAGKQGENFLQEMKKLIDGGFEPPISELQRYRRLCIHSNVLNFISSKPFGPRVRSFVCFSRDEIIMPIENISDIPTAFKLVRVLDVNPIKFNRIPSELYHLVHLRYVALSFINVAILPAAFSKLWNLETLIFFTTSRTLEVKADIWEMIHLRHLKTNASATLHKKGKSNEGGENLQTLGTISPESCTEEVFDRACNLKKLSIRGQLALILDGQEGSFHSFHKLDQLEKLKLLNDIFSGPPSKGKLSVLPPPNKFPPRLRSLTLSDTFLDWSQMSILGLLENLEILKLRHKSFMGKYWETADGGFRRLETLHIERVNLVSWVASSHHFPRLRHLHLRNCDELRELPPGLADIPSLHLLELHLTKFAVASAKIIYVAKQKQQEEQAAKVSGFKLSIFPPDD
ncbi:Apoptotic ATPase [Handroanthus impetiginosus]|uniref:Apoptotic ATPase n=1 Tax=Handroanthus impetiginosus TaxID=429701 RepID=A0A2G9HR56_9LAMI|nr:Apoptotic ATPase [Handroanthus impetiginosus]